MFIKKVVVTWDGMRNYYPRLRILFYDHNGNLFESGSTISSASTKAETDNFIVTTSRSADSTAGYPINAISTEVHKDINNGSLPHFCGAPNYGNKIIIEFKTNQLYSGYTKHHVKYLEQVRDELELQTGTHISLPNACGIWRYMSFCNPSKNKLSGRFNIPDETLSVEISKFLTGRKPYTKMR